MTVAQCARQCGSGVTGWPTSSCSRNCRKVKQRSGSCGSSSGQRKLVLAAAPVGDVAASFCSTLTGFAAFEPQIEVLLRHVGICILLDTYASAIVCCSLDWYCTGYCVLQCVTLCAALCCSCNTLPIVRIAVGHCQLAPAGLCCVMLSSAMAAACYNI